MLFALALLVAALLAGAIGAISGFGIGSLLTPILALRLGTHVAIVAVAVPHAAATTLRAWRLRDAISMRVLRTFGLASAAGGLLGALLHVQLANRALTLTFAALLVLAGLSNLTGMLERIQLGRVGSLVAGLLSGVFGGLVGNQGGIRTAALLTADLAPRALVATATASGLIVDAVRLPIYLWTSGHEIRAAAGAVAITTAGALIGTLAGEPLLRRLPEKRYRQIVSVLLLLLGVAMAASALDAHQRG